MSHEITETKGKAEMAYKGEVPWHGLGQKLPEGAPIEKWVEAAGMDWVVNRSPVAFEVLSGKKRSMNQWDDKHVLFRSDNGYPLGVVSDSYKIVQPKEVMEFFRELCKANEFTMETAGTLFGGRRYWALARIGEEAQVVKGDKMKGYLLLSTSADGTRATVAKFVGTRVVCYNTMSIADSEKGGSRVSTSHRTEFKADQVKTDLGIGHAMFKQYMEQCKLLTQVPVSKEQAKKFLGQLLNEYHVDKGEKIDESRGFVRMLELYDGKGKGMELPGVKGTAWGLVNAVTEYIDHHRRAAIPDTRLNNVWFGIGDRIKSAAFAMAQAQVWVKKGDKK